MPKDLDLLPTTLREIRDDIKELRDILKVDINEVKTDLNILQNELTEIKSKMPSTDRVQGLEIQLASMQSQFRVVWAALGAVGLVAIGSIVASIFKLIAA